MLAELTLRCYATVDTLLITRFDIITMPLPAARASDIDGMLSAIRHDTPRCCYVCC